MSDQHQVSLDKNFTGPDVVVVKSGSRLCGTGACLASTALSQSKSYFEVTIQATGVWGVGVALRDCNLSQVPMGGDQTAWVLRSDCEVMHNNEAICSVACDFDEGDIISVYFDHIQLRFARNGTEICGVPSIRGGPLYPVLYVDDGAILDVDFVNFRHQVPDGFSEIIVEKNIF